MLDEVDSTQRFASGLLKSGQPGDVVFAHHQNAGKGRFDRVWLSERGASLTFSIILREAADHPKPWLIGMASAVCAARICGCKVQWPNDLVSGAKKLGGTLVELVPDQERRLIPILGIGINVKQRSMPEAIEPIATSLALLGIHKEPVDLALDIEASLRGSIPNEWADIRDAWTELDETPGKTFRLWDGEIGKAVSLTDQGALIVNVGGEMREVLAADAVFGRR